MAVVLAGFWEEVDGVGEEGLGRRAVLPRRRLAPIMKEMDFAALGSGEGCSGSWEWLFGWLIWKYRWCQKM